MPQVCFNPSGKSVEVPSGTTLFDAAHLAGLPVASSCAAEFVCGKCNMTIVYGAENLTSQTEPERKLLVREGRPPTDRISCHTRVRGACTVSTSYW